MRFTIVTPVLNGMPWLPECVASVDAQRDDVDVEHLVLDAGSTDGSRPWLQQHATRATLVFEPDRGQTDALVNGFARASGDVLGWLNADDRFEPRALARVVAVLSGRPDAVAAVGSMLFVDENGAVLGISPPPADGGFDDLLHFPNALPQPAVLFRRAAYLACGGLDRRYDLAMDQDLWLRLARVGTFVPMPSDVLARFRLHKDAKSVRQGARAAREDLEIRRGHGLRMLSPAGFNLLRFGYAQPALASTWRRFGKPLAARLLGEPRG